MINIKKEWDCILLGEFLWIGDCKKVEILLKKFRWKDIAKFWIKSKKVVDYPWEYHFNIANWIYITVYEWDDKKLNFIIEWLDDDLVAFVQDGKVLTNEWFEDVNIWVFEDSTIEDYLDKMEYEWERIKV